MGALKVVSASRLVLHLDPPRRTLQSSAYI